ncbi:MAG: 4'-phosphopantetheinyl transferase superfamily protein [Tissierellia bacterium]|nr:4'-phosphopantetheinyl transferase superfamily protein [Tissierellia bacterium]
MVDYKEVVVFKYAFFNKEYSNQLLKEILSGNSCILTIDVEKLRNVINYQWFLTESEKEKYLSFTNDIKANAFMKSHSLLNFLFSNWINVGISELIYRTDQNGKPYLDNEYGIQFNISHTDGYFAIVFSLSTVGIDIECKENLVNIENIASRFYCYREKALNIETQGVLWCVKEAIAKLKGMSIMDAMAHYCLEKINIDEFEMCHLESNEKIIVKIIISNKDYICAYCKE